MFPYGAEPLQRPYYLHLFTLFTHLGLALGLKVCFFWNDVIRPEWAVKAGKGDEEWPGARFSKVPIINGPGKLSPFTLKIEVSIVLHLA